MVYYMTYGPYKELVETGHQTIETNSLNMGNIEYYEDGIIAILQDGIETKEVQSMMVTVIFADRVDVDLTIFDFLYNLMFWTLRVGINKPIESIHLFWYEDLTKSRIKKYMDNTFVREERTEIDFKTLNNLCDDALGGFRKLTQFQEWLANTVNFEDTIELMKKYPEFNDTMHLSLANEAMVDVKDIGMDAAWTQINYIKNSEDHCLKHSFRTGEAISPKQYKEVAVHIGSKPDGRGGVFPSIIDHSFLNGGLQTPEELCIDSSVGRIAQILEKGNVGESGAFARRLGLNNQDTKIHYNPNYSCDTKNFEIVTIKNATMLQMYDMRYYRFKPKDVDHLLDATKDKHLIGQTLYFRSPMTCASAARGQGICYKCYGNLAYVNRDINPGQIAAEQLSSIYTQRLLSAKHLLESKVIAMEWTPGFEDWFDINFNTIALYEDKEYRGIQIIIPTDIQNDDEYDDVLYADYVTGFKIRFGNGDELDIHTADADDIFIHPDFMDIIETYTPTQDGYIIDAAKLMDVPILFMVNFKNSELSRTMQEIKNLVDNKTTIAKYDRNTLLEAFIDTNIEGDIVLNAVHFEVMLMNQIRAADNILALPEWELEDEPCQILTLGEALSNNLSMAIRLQSNKIEKTFMDPHAREVTKPSNMDVYFMEQPQEYLSDKEIVDDSYKLKNDVESSVTNPLYFFDEEDNDNNE